MSIQELHEKMGREIKAAKEANLITAKYHATQAVETAERLIGELIRENNRQWDSILKIGKATKALIGDKIDGNQER